MQARAVLLQTEGSVLHVHPFDWWFGLFYQQRGKKLTLIKSADDPAGTCICSRLCRVGPHRGHKPGPTSPAELLLPDPGRGVPISMGANEAPLPRAAAWGEFLLNCSGSPVLSAQSQPELYLGTSPLLPFQFRCSFFAMQRGWGGPPCPATFLISFLHIKTMTHLKLPGSC